MTDHLPSHERRAQIVQAMLELLADTPVEAITTRQIAAHLGLSQPAIFRHFRSRDDILEAAIGHARDDLGRLAGAVLGADLPPVAGLAELARGLFAHVERQPGLPRVLFHDAIASAGPRIRKALQALMSTQQELVAELVREAQRRNELPAHVAPERAGRLFVALVQGLLLQWQLAGRAFPLAAEAVDLARFWGAAVAAGEPRVAAPGSSTASAAPMQAQPAPTARPAPPDASACHCGVPAVEPAPARLAPPDASARHSGVPAVEPAVPADAPPPGHCALIRLDVRPILAAGTDPLRAILAALAQTAPDGMLKVTAPFRPAPLLALLTSRGCRTDARALGPALWDVEIRPPGAPDVVDLRDLEAPLPLEQVLVRTAALTSGAALLARVPQVPRLLLPRLHERGLEFAILEEPDGSALLYVRRPA